MSEIAGVLGPILSFLGAFFFFASAVGLVRLPDLFSRMHAPTKAGSLGLAFLALGSLVSGMGEGGELGLYWLEDFLLLVVVFLTLPVSAQVLAKSARRRLAAPGDQSRSRPGEGGGLGPSAGLRTRTEES